MKHETIVKCLTGKQRIKGNVQRKRKNEKYLIRERRKRKTRRRQGEVG